jgi:hypothetical protein
MREQAKILEQKTDLALLGRQQRDLAITNRDASGSRPVKSRNGFEGEGFAGAVGTKEDEDFPFLDLQIAAPQNEVAELQRQVFDREHASHHPVCAARPP